MELLSEPMNEMILNSKVIVPLSDRSHVASDTVVYPGTAGAAPICIP